MNNDDEVIFVSRKRMSPIDREAHKIRRTSFEINEIVRSELAETAKEKAYNEEQAAKERAQDEADEAKLNEIRKAAEAIKKFCDREEQKMDNEMHDLQKKLQSKK